MKNFSTALLAASLLLVQTGFSQDEATSSSTVAEELSEEAAILRALVEEYKAKAAGSSQPQQTKTIPEMPAVILNDTPVKSAPKVVDDPGLSSLAAEVKEIANSNAVAPAIQSVESMIPTPQTPVAPETPKMEGAISSVNNLLSNPIESVESVIPETKSSSVEEAISKMDPTVIAEKSDFPKIEAPVIDRSAIPSLEEPDPVSNMKEAVAAINPIPESPKTPDTSELPKMETPIVATSDAPSLETPAEPAVKAPSLEDDPLFAALAERAKKAAETAKEAETTVAEKMAATEQKIEPDAVIISDPVVTEEVAEMKEEAPTPLAAEIAPEDPPAEKPVVTKADEMKPAEVAEEATPKIAEKTVPKVEPSQSAAEKPLVVATKRPTTKKEVPPKPAASQPTEEATIAATQPAPSAPAGSAPAGSAPTASARSATPLKDLGRMLFGPKDGSSRGGPIFKRRKR